MRKARARERARQWRRKRAMSEGRIPRARPEFGKAPKVEIGGRFKEPAEDLDRGLLEAIACETRRDHRILVRPDRAVVIAHRVEPNLAI